MGIRLSKVFDGLKRHWPVLPAAFAWMITFAVAYSDCSIQSLLTTTCNLWKPQSYSSITDLEKIAALKGQFGDTFGILNGVFGAVTLWLVYLAYKREHESSSAQIQFVRLERYYAEVDTAVQAYNRLVEAILVPDGEKQAWPGRHGLFHLWKICIVKTLFQRCVERVASQTPPLTTDHWNGAVQTYRLRVLSPADETSKSVASKLANLSQVESIAMRSDLSSCWRTLYEQNGYQIDALYRAWYQACKAIANTNEFNVDSGTEWRAAARFRAQLSWIELVFLLANQALSDGPDGNGFPKACRFSERYAMFDNFALGTDPCVHTLRAIADESAQSTKPRLKVAAFSSESARQANAVIP